MEQLEKDGIVKISNARLTFESRVTGEKIEINNDFQESLHPEYDYENVENDFSVAFKKDITEKDFMRFYFKDTEAAINHIGLGWYNPKTDNLNIFKAPNKTEARIEGNVIYFDEVYPEINLKYVLNEYGIKDFLKIENPFTLNPAEYGFESDCYLVLVNYIEHSEAFCYSGSNEDLAVYFLDQNQDIHYVSPPNLIAYDADFNKDKVSKWLKIVDGKHYLLHGVQFSTIVNGRAYPYTIDATFTVNGANQFYSTNAYIQKDILVDGSNLYTVNANGISKFNAINGINSTTRLVGTSGWSFNMTCDANTIYVASYVNNQIWRWNTKGVALPTIFTTSGTVPQEIAVYGNFLYFIDNLSGYIYKTDLTTLTTSVLVSQFSFFKTGLSRIAVDSTGVYASGNTNTSMVYKYNLLGGIAWVSTLGQPITDLTSDGTNYLYVAAQSNTATCFRLSINDGTGSQVFTSVLPGSYIEYSNGYLYFLANNWVTSSLYLIQRIDISTGLLDPNFLYKNPNSGSNGFAVSADGLQIYYYYGLTYTLFNIDTVNGTTQQSTTFIPSTVSSYIATDSNYIYTTNDGYGITRHDKTTGKYVPQYLTFPGITGTDSLVDCKIDSNYIYVSNNGQFKIKRYNKSTGVYDSSGWTDPVGGQPFCMNSTYIFNPAATLNAVNFQYLKSTGAAAPSPINPASRVAGNPCACNDQYLIYKISNGFIVWSISGNNQFATGSAIPNYIAVNSTNMFFVTGPSGTYVLSSYTISSLAQIKSFSIFYCDKIEASDKYVIVYQNFFNRILVLDATNISTVIKIISYPSYNYVGGAISGDYLYTTWQRTSVAMLNIADPKSSYIPNSTLSAWGLTNDANFIYTIDSNTMNILRYNKTTAQLDNTTGGAFSCTGNPSIQFLKSDANYLYSADVNSPYNVYRWVKSSGAMDTSFSATFTPSSVGATPQMAIDSTYAYVFDTSYTKIIKVRLWDGGLDTTNWSYFTNPSTGINTVGSLLVDSNYVYFVDNSYYLRRFNKVTGILDETGYTKIYGGAAISYFKFYIDGNYIYLMNNYPAIYKYAKSGVLSTDDGWVNPKTTGQQIAYACFDSTFIYYVLTNDPTILRSINKFNGNNGGSHTLPFSCYGLGYDGTNIYASTLYYIYIYNKSFSQIGGKILIDSSTQASLFSVSNYLYAIIYPGSGYYQLRCFDNNTLLPISYKSKLQLPDRARGLSIYGNDLYSAPTSTTGYRNYDLTTYALKGAYSDTSNLVGLDTNSSYVYTSNAYNTFRHNRTTGALQVLDRDTSYDALVYRNEPKTTTWNWSVPNSTQAITDTTSTVDEGYYDNTDPKNPVWVPALNTYNGITSFPYYYFQMTLPGNTITSATLALKSYWMSTAGLGGLLPSIATTPYKPFIDTPGLFTNSVDQWNRQPFGNNGQAYFNFDPNDITGQYIYAIDWRTNGSPAYLLRFFARTNLLDSSWVGQMPAVSNPYFSISNGYYFITSNNSGSLFKYSLTTGLLVTNTASGAIISQDCDSTYIYGVRNGSIFRWRQDDLTMDPIWYNTAMNNAESICVDASNDAYFVTGGNGAYLSKYKISDNTLYWSKSININNTTRISCDPINYRVNIGTGVGSAFIQYDYNGNSGASLYPSAYVYYSKYNHGYIYIMINNVGIVKYDSNLNPITYTNITTYLTPMDTTLNLDYKDLLQNYITTQLSGAYTNISAGLMILPVNQSNSTGTFFANYFETGTSPVLTVTTTSDTQSSSTGSLFFAKG